MTRKNTCDPLSLIPKSEDVRRRLRVVVELQRRLRILLRTAEEIEADERSLEESRQHIEEVVR